jgi:hypothetical protein
MDIKECEGYKKLLTAAEKDERNSPGFHRYFEKVDWVVARAQHYAEKTGVDSCDILNSWEKHRRYWYMNYYQECNQPKIDAVNVRVFETTDDLQKAIGDAGFRCPSCGGVSKSPYECMSGKEISKGKICDWKVYGLLGDLGKGITVFVKDQIHANKIFMPIAWETSITHATKA